MEQAGFVITPLHHQQAQQVLKAFGTKHLYGSLNADLTKLEALKYRLAPVFVSNEVEQEKFYQLYTQYIEELQKVTLQPAPPPPPPPDHKNWDILPWVLIAGIILLGIAVASQYFNKEKKGETNKMVCDFQILHPNEEVPIGDTLKTNNLTQHDTTGTPTYTWHLFDKDASEHFHHSDNHHLLHHLKTIEKGKHEKTIRLIAQDSFHTDTITKDFTVICRNQPLSLTIQTNLQENIAQVEQEITFSFSTNAEKNVCYEWNFGDKTPIEVGINPKHSFQKEGVYEVIVTATKDTLGHCETILEKFPVSVGSEQVPLTFMEPVADKITPTISFQNWLWWPLGILTALSWGFYFWRAKKAKEEQEQATQAAIKAAEEKAQKALADSFAAPDKAPYFIPYQNNNGLIRMATETYRMADILRARQEGLRQVLDIPTTIQQTIEQGGFPAVAFKQSTTPPEYLFLLDEKESNSHQKRLFQFLTQFLRDKDIHLEAFWYRGTMHHFWNEQHPKGLDLATLQRSYPLHKLVVMGNGHELLHPYGGTDLLRPEFASLIAAWQNRVLLTPQPVVSWTYREAAIAQLILPFPADMRGFRTALPYLEIDQEELEEQVLNFDEWTSKLQANHPQPDVNYKKWRKLKDYQKYLADRKDLYKWLCALAVHPRPTWELTIAIGRALESPEQPLLTYDNLLILSHIPWLQGQDLSPGLRAEFIAELQRLSPTAEDKARKAVQAALQNKEVQALIKDSHANFEWQSEQVFQEFALNPNNVANNRKLHYLLDQLNRRQRMALQQSLERNYELGKVQMRHKGIPDLAKHLSDSLEQVDGGDEQIPPTIPTKRPWWLYLALTTTLLALAGALAIFSLNQSDWLYGQVKGTPPESIICEETLETLFFLEDCPVSSEAVKWNNYAVSVWEKDSLANVQKTDRVIADSIINRIKDIRDTFQLAVNLAENKEYPLAQHNLDKLHFNLGTAYYESYFNGNQTDKALLDSAFVHLWYLEQSDSIQLEGWHALGLSAFYKDSINFATSYQNRILQVDANWFNNLKTEIHLQWLLERYNQSTPPPIDPTTLAILISSPAPCLNGNNCEAEKRWQASTTIPIENATWSVLLLDENKNVLAQTAGNSIRYTLQSGQTIIPTFTLFYQGQEIKKEGKAITFRDCQRPRFVLNDNPSIALNSEGKTNITVDILAEVDGFRDNCTDNTTLQNNFRIWDATLGQSPKTIATIKNLPTSITLNCENLGINTFKCYVFDEADNWSVGDITVNLEDKANVCNTLTPPIVEDNSFTDPRDKQTYKTVTIGKQTWFAQNLNYNTNDSWCYLELPEFCQKAGRLYTWEAAKRACPKGWHLPTDEEWKTLLDNYGGEGTVAYQALIQGGNSNFTALLGGSRFSDGEFFYLSENGFYWSASERGADDAWFYSFTSDGGGGNTFSKAYGLSCRCLKD